MIPGRMGRSPLCSSRLGRRPSLTSASLYWIPVLVTCTIAQAGPGRPRSLPRSRTVASCPASYPRYDNVPVARGQIFFLYFYVQLKAIHIPLMAMAAS